MVGPTLGGAKGRVTTAIYASNPAVLRERYASPESVALVRERQQPGGRPLVVRGFTPDVPAAGGLESARPGHVGRSAGRDRQRGSGGPRRADHRRGFAGAIVALAVRGRGGAVSARIAAAYRAQTGHLSHVLVAGGTACSPS
jgi:hypothetical protein